MSTLAQYARSVLWPGGGDRHMAMGRGGQVARLASALVLVSTMQNGPESVNCATWAWLEATATVWEMSFPPAATLAVS